MTPRMDLHLLIDEPRERLDVEYKGWLNLQDNHDQRVLAKALMAMANHGGGYVILGMVEGGATIRSVPPPRETEITQDAVSGIVRRYAEPAFQCEVHVVTSSATNVQHPIIVVPGGMREPVMSKRDGPPLRQHAFYVRKPGPQSEEPRTAAEWRELLNRCVLANQDELLDAIRTMIGQQRDSAIPTPNISDDLRNYCAESNARWAELASDLPPLDPARFPDGYWEIGLSVVGTPPVSGLSVLKTKVEESERVVFSGWPLFITLEREELKPRAIDKHIEAWLGRPNNSAVLNGLQYYDFWRASPDGMLYSIKGYTEDGTRQVFGRPGCLLDITITIRRIAEALLFANRFGETFDHVSSIAVRYRFTGLEGRSLSVLPWYNIPHSLHRTCRTASFDHDASVTTRQIRDNLAEVVQTLLSPLCEQFDFYKLPMPMIQEQLRQTLPQT